MSGNTAQQRKQAFARQRIESKRAAEAAARAHAQRRRRTVLGAVVAAVLVLVALVVVIVVQTQRTATPDTAAVPAGTVADGSAVAVGGAEAPVVVDLYEDFLCPSCRQFETVNGETLQALVDDGTVQLRYHPIAILDRYSTDDYSTRSLNAAGVVLDAAGAEAFAEFHRLLFGAQPAEGGPGLSDDQLTAFAAEAGATGPAVEAGIRDRVFEDWTRQVTDVASQDGVAGTPTLLVDGEEVPLADATPENITGLVETAAAG